jgi:Methyl-accepting chemotaxis protein (MCP) signalling domain
MISAKKFSPSHAPPEKQFRVSFHVELSHLCKVDPRGGVARRTHGSLSMFNAFVLRALRAPASLKEAIRVLAGGLAVSAVTALLCLYDTPFIAEMVLVIGASLAVAMLAAVAGSSPPIARRGNVEVTCYPVEDVATHLWGSPLKSGHDVDFATVADTPAQSRSNSGPRIERPRKEAESRCHPQAAREENQEAIARFRASVGVMLGQLAANADRLVLASDRIDEMVDQSTRRTELAINSARTSSKSTHSVDIASQALGASIKAIESQVLAMRGVVTDATRTIKETTHTIDGLAFKTNEIGEIVGLIQAIAGQTNLLALNATIEAARAGEAGKGFAVVAQEVKSQANQTASATERIAEHVSAIQHATISAVEAVAMIGVTMRQADDFTESIAAAVESQGDITVKIEIGSSQAAGGAESAAAIIDELKASLSETAAAVKEARSAASDARAQTRSLLETADAFLLRLVSR